MLNEYTNSPLLEAGCTAIVNGENCVETGDSVAAEAIPVLWLTPNTYRCKSSEPFQYKLLPLVPIRYFPLASPCNSHMLTGLPPTKLPGMNVRIPPVPIE